MRHTGGFARGGNLYQIKTLFPGLSGRILRRHDAKLLAVRANHAYFTCADPLIHLNKAFIYAILLNPPGKLTLLVELRGAPHACGKTVKIIAWVDACHLFCLSAVCCETASCDPLWEFLLRAQLREQQEASAESLWDSV